MINKIRKLHKNNKGVTLVEILAAIAISGIIMTVIGSLFSFGFSGVENVQELASKQRDITIAKNYFSRELNNATEVNIVSSLPSSIDNSYNYIYLEDNTLKLVSNSNNRVITKDVSSLNFQVIENTSSNDLYNYYLKYSINGNETDLILNNLEEYTAGQNHSVIQYKTP